MRIELYTVAYQIYVTPYIKVTHSKLLNGHYEFIIGWLKWQLIIEI